MEDWIRKRVTHTYRITVVITRWNVYKIFASYVTQVALTRYHYRALMFVLLVSMPVSYRMRGTSWYGRWKKVATRLKVEWTTAFSVNSECFYKKKIKPEVRYLSAHELKVQVHFCYQALIVADRPSVVNFLILFFSKNWWTDFDETWEEAIT